MASGEQFGISFKGTVKKHFLGIREILEIFQWENENTGHLGVLPD